MLGEFGPVLHAMAKLGIPASVVDDMELWQLAAMLGVDIETDSAALPSDSDILAARVAAARGERPPPEPEPITWLDPNTVASGWNVRDI